MPKVSFSENVDVIHGDDDHLREYMSQEEYIARFKRNEQLDEYGRTLFQRQNEEHLRLFKEYMVRSKEIESTRQAQAQAIEDSHTCLHEAACCLLCIGYTLCTIS